VRLLTLVADEDYPINPNGQTEQGRVEVYFDRDTTCQPNGFLYEAGRPLGDVLKRLGTLYSPVRSTVFFF
jgi:hypothetical protein